MPFPINKNLSFLYFSRRRSKGTSLKVKKKLDMENEQIKNETHVNVDVLGNLQMKEKPNYNTLGIHDSNDVSDVVIDNSPKGNTQESFEMKRQLSSTKSAPCKLALPMDNKKLEVVM